MSRRSLWALDSACLALQALVDCLFLKLVRGSNAGIRRAQPPSLLLLLSFLFILGIAISSCWSMKVHSLPTALNTTGPLVALSL